jgi:hypothetical protein
MGSSSVVSLIAEGDHVFVWARYTAMHSEVIRGYCRQAGLLNGTLAGLRLVDGLIVGEANLQGEVGSSTNCRQPALRRSDCILDPEPSFRVRTACRYLRVSVGGCFPSR